MQCRDFREIADSYLGDELIVETNHDVLRHLESCADCRRELAARRELRSKLRAAFTQDADLQISAAFGRRLRRQLQTGTVAQQPPRATRGAWLALAAGLLLATTFGLYAVRWQLHAPAPGTVARAPVEATTPPTQGTQGSWRTIMAGLGAIAVGDHRDCALKFNLAARPIALDEAGQKYDHAYLGLARAVAARAAGPTGLPDQLKIVEAHSCIFEGRRFGHIVFKYHDRVVSLLVTDLGGSSDQPADAATDANAAQRVINCTQLDGYQVSSFDSARHAVFIVSELSETENLTIARALAPALLTHLTHAEQIA